MTDLHIRTREILKIKDVIGKEGPDYKLKLESGLVFLREENVCKIKWCCFSTIVDRMSVSKNNVMFENTENRADHIYISRSKKCPF
jgi:hypothetical protein